MLIFSPHNWNLCLESQETRFLWNIFEAVQKTRRTCFIGIKTLGYASCFYTPIKHCCSFFKHYSKQLFPVEQAWQWPLQKSKTISLTVVRFHSWKLWPRSISFTTILKTGEIVAYRYKDKKALKSDREKTARSRF